MQPTRRNLLRAAGAAAVFSIVPRQVLGGPDHVAPSELVNIALVGAGGQGRTNLRRRASGPNRHRPRTSCI